MRYCGLYPKLLPSFFSIACVTSQQGYAVCIFILAIKPLICYMHMAYGQSQILREISRHAAGQQPPVGA